MDENLLRISCFVAIVWNSENNDKFVAIVKFINTLVVKIYLKELQLNYFADWKLLIAQLKYCQKEGNVFYHTLIKTNTKIKTKTKYLKDPTYGTFLKVQGYQIWHWHACLVVSCICLVMPGECLGASGCVCIMRGHIWWWLMESCAYLMIFGVYIVMSSTVLCMFGSLWGMFDGLWQCLEWTTA